MASRATGGTFAAFLISAAILGFAGGAFLGTQSDGESDNGGNPESAATSPAGGDAGGEEDAAPETTPDEPEEEPAGDGAIALTAAQDSVSASEQIDISGTIDPPEEGVQLQIQRSVDGGDYQDFPVAPWTTNADGEFSGYVQSGQSGENSFRVVRVDDPEATSEAVVVQVD